MLQENAIQDYLANYEPAFERQVSFYDESPLPTAVETKVIDGIPVTYYTNQFWTARQRQASSIHEISYRACFKPQLPLFFIELFTGRGDLVYDPFSGRGTTAVEAALSGRRVAANDVNPLSRILTEPRLEMPEEIEITKRLDHIDLSPTLAPDLDLSMFYHPDTEKELLALRLYLQGREAANKSDCCDRWIRMVATNRLSGHSKGFFSVYTMPPNQAVTPERQVKINLKLGQAPDYRDVKNIIKRKTGQLLKKVTAVEKERLREAAKSALYLENDAAHTPEIETGSVALTVTSPPFLNIVQYSKDNWLRCWFNSIDMTAVEKKITMASSLVEWSGIMAAVLKELFRITKPGGWVAFEVGEVRKGRLMLEEAIVPLATACGFKCPGVIINRQDFTKTSNIWGVDNNRLGTNSNRIVLLVKEPL